MQPIPRARCGNRSVYPYPLRACQIGHGEIPHSRASTVAGTLERVTNTSSSRSSSSARFGILRCDTGASPSGNTSQVVHRCRQSWHSCRRRRWPWVVLRVWIVTPLPPHCGQRSSSLRVGIHQSQIGLAIALALSVVAAATDQAPASSCRSQGGTGGAGAGPAAADAPTGQAPPPLALLTNRATDRSQRSRSDPGARWPDAMAPARHGPTRSPAASRWPDQPAAGHG
jgi:hypothetical protein